MAKTYAITNPFVCFCDFLTGNREKYPATDSGLLFLSDLQPLFKEASVFNSGFLHSWSAVKYRSFSNTLTRRFSLNTHMMYVKRKICSRILLLSGFPLGWMFAGLFHHGVMVSWEEVGRLYRCSCGDDIAGRKHPDSFSQLQRLCWEEFILAEALCDSCGELKRRPPSKNMFVLFFEGLGLFFSFRFFTFWWCFLRRSRLWRPL